MMCRVGGSFVPNLILSQSPQSTSRVTIRAVCATSLVLCHVLLCHLLLSGITKPVVL